VLAVAALALCLNRALNGDLYLLLFTGRYVAEHGPVSHDPFPTIEHGQSWLNQQWLSELGFYEAFRIVGVKGITVLYALLIAAPLGLVLAVIRRKGAVMMIAVAALYVPGLAAIIHPRAAGFTLLAFCVLLAVILAARGPSTKSAARPAGSLWALVAIPLLFALWANLHGGFIAGLLLIGLVVAGLAIDRWRGLSGAMAGRRIVVLAVAGVLAAVAATFATPLGVDIWTYILSFRNPALKLASTEWEPTTQSVPAMAYIVIAAAFAAWIWLRAPAPRPVVPVIAVAGFLLFATGSMRNLIFIAPVLALQIAWSAPSRLAPPPRAVLGLAAAAAAGALLAYVVILGTPNADRVGNPAVQYAIQHPLKRGRIVAYAGPSSYILWRAPTTPVAIDGWLEHFSEGELRANFGILHGSRANPTPYVKRLNAGAVIAYLPYAIERLEANGFVARYSGPDGTYLVRPSNATSTGTASK
jgi:hypothetical protein